MAKKIRVWDGSAWQDVAPALPYSAVHSAQASMPLTAVDGQIWLDTDASVPSTSVTRWYKLPAAGTTTLSGNDENSIPLAYTPGYEQVYLNGTLLSRGGADYTATTGTSIVLSSAIVAGDVVEVICPLQITTTDTYTQSAADNKFVQNSGNFAVGKNKLINGDFSVWQRGTSFTSSAVNEYTADRWRTEGNSLSTVISRQLFVSGQTDVPNNPTYFCRVTTNSSISSGQYWALMQRIETPSEMFAKASTTLTLSFWARSVSGTIAANTFTFGDLVSLTGNPTITTSWQKIVYTYTTASSSYAGFYPLYVINLSSGKPAISIDIANIQLEFGNQATQFQTATGTIQGELAACQRYYYRVNANGISGYSTYGQGAVNSTTQLRTIVPFPVTMRAKPSAIDYPALSNFSIINFADGDNQAPSAVMIDSNQTDANSGFLLWTGSALTVHRPMIARSNGAAAYLGWSAEL